MNKLIAAACAVLMLAGCTRADAPSPASPPASASAVQQALARSGLIIAGPLDAPKGYRGFIGLYHGRKLPVYVMPDGKHVVVGSMYDMDGHDLTTAAMRKAADVTFGKAQWQALEKSTWVAEGDPHAKRVVYVFTDPDCTYCHQFWQAAQPWLAKGGVQVRNILVAVISPASLPRAEAILESGNPGKAWRYNEQHFGHAGATSKGKSSAAIIRKIRANNTLLMHLGFYGTPGVIYKDAHGHIRAVHGMPANSRALKAIFAG